MIIAGTGHRPKYLPCGYNEQHPSCKTLKTKLAIHLRRFPVDHVICGGALGWDMWLAESALNAGLTLSLYLPFPGYEKRWPIKSQHRLQGLIEKSHFHGYAEDRFSMAAYHKRNMWMVDDVDEIWALYNKDLVKSGTHKTVVYAEEKYKPITNFWNDYI